MIMPIASPCKPHDCGDSYQSEVGHGETLLDCLFLHLVIFFEFNVNSDNTKGRGFPSSVLLLFFSNSDQHN